MVKNFLRGGKNLLYSKQANILSAAAIIMFMVAASGVLGLIKQRTLVHFFATPEVDVFLAAFQLPDLLFEVLVLGALTSAFIPVFSSYLAKDKSSYLSKAKQKEGWYTAAATLNILLLFFAISSILIFVFAEPLYSLIAQGFSPEQISQTVSFTRILLLVQLIFAASFLLTGVLESHQRFFAPALAPLFYNVGIIGTTVIFANRLGLLAPVLGAVAGSLLHLLIQLPLALELGFRPVLALDLKNPGFQRIVRLALPRVVELAFLQVKRLTDLFLASLFVGGFTYFKFASSLALLPVSFFGLSIAKASFPFLSRQAAKGNLDDFKNTFSSTLKEILFLIIPMSFFLAVLRIPAVRLVFGAERFSWPDTVQTGYVLSAFAVGMFAYALSLFVSRSFYALQDTATPVKISVLTTLVNVTLAFILISGLGLPIWALALSYSLAGIVQISILLILLGRRVGGFAGFGLGQAFAKITASAGLAGGTMFILLKILDRSAWDKKLSFLGEFGLALPTTFDRFVLDTRYTVNLIFLTGLVVLIGGLVYLLMAYLLRIEELRVVVRALQKISRMPRTPAPATEEGETIAPPPTNGA